MNPAVVQFITSIVVRLLTALGGYLIAKGLLTADQVGLIQDPAAQAIVGAILVGLGTLYGVVRTWIDRKKIVTALATQPMTEAQLEDRIGDGRSAAVTTPKTVMPQLKV